ncbi:enoyl-CoA hydratase [Burkholderia cepacia]|uniref:enoyl-CoA hydratase-related protein n=1 Tax=Burkholderia cepacia TaxID=292 RepID=UPI00075FC5E9|nr:enoyl-CoA hydratase-related protein [Burkholderia cepacia]KWE18343.1 enoyl-CoA hydratase [Burkholderia cepacia]
MSDPVVQLSYPFPQVALVRINRPDARNALNKDVRALINRYFTELSDNPEIRAIVLAGTEKYFAAGGDIREMNARSSIALAIEADRTTQLMVCRKPVIAAVNGYALGGGCEYAMQCDIVICNDEATFGQPEVKLGLVPGAGGTQRLPRVVGKHNAMYMLLTGNFVRAEQALRMGLVSEIVPGNCDDRALEIAREIAALPPLTVMQIKDTVLSGADIPLASALRIETKAHELMYGTEDMREGTRAFAEKRTPHFQGR